MSPMELFLFDLDCGMCFNRSMNVGPLPGTTEVNTPQALPGTTASGDDDKIGKFESRTVAVSGKSVINGADLFADNISMSNKSYKQLNERKVEAVNYDEKSENFPRKSENWKQKPSAKELRASGR